MSEFIRVDEWQPEPADIKITYDGKIVIIPFHELFGRDIDAVNNFFIKKESYSKKLPEITHYINYFIKYYDPENELLFAYLKLKFFVDKKQLEGKKNGVKRNAFIKIMHSIMFSKSMVAKIDRMVEDNYYIDVTSNDSEKKYAESLKFTNDHARVMMKISVSMKLMVPIMFHYINTYLVSKTDSVDIYPFYEKLFDIYGSEILIYNKLWHSVNVKVSMHYAKNKVLWQQREFKGTNELEQVDYLLRDKIISETFFKYSFEKNIINFNSVVMERQLNYFRIEKYPYNYIELSNQKDSNEGLSGLDKLAMSLDKVDESLSILSEINIKQTIKKIKNKINITITKEEIAFYMANHVISSFQTQLVFNFFAKYFQGFRDLNMLTRKQYIKLVILLKKMLQLQNKVYLPQILTANILKLNSRTIQNTKFLNKIETSSTYQAIAFDKFEPIEQIKKNSTILNILSTMINTTFTLVDFEVIPKTGEPLVMVDDVLSDEVLDFLNQL